MLAWDHGREARPDSRSATSAPAEGPRRSACSASRSGSTSSCASPWSAATSTTCPGAGKPIKDLGAQHDPDWWIKRLIEREKITGVLPPALQLRKDDAELDARLDRHTAESEVRRELEEFNARVMKARYTPVDGPPLVTMPRDVDAEVTRWRERMRERREAARNQPAVRREAAPPKARAQAVVAPLRAHWSGSSVTCQGLQPLTSAGIPGYPGVQPARQNRSGSASRARCEVRVARHSCLLIGVHETASPFLRAGTVRQ